VDDEPVLVYLNHPGWWDPLIGLMLAAIGFPDRRHFAPIDAKALKEYAFFQKLGFFGIEPNSQRGGAQFIRIGQAIMQQPSHALWVTAQGRFTDPRERPVTLRPGVAHLAPRLERGRIVPLALEYPFWDEKKPEALACFGEPIDVAQAEKTAEHWQNRLTEHMQHSMDRLAHLARRRNPDDWRVLLSGQVGTTGFYDLWRAGRAAIRGRRFQRAHGAITRDD
jgi:1-acyl-sn-glycerol-3-phosphate acyltransferase